MRIRRSELLMAAFMTLFLLAGCARPGPNSDDETQVRAVVTAFGGKLGQVSLLAPTAADDIRTQYAPYVSPALLEQWASDPSKAPGRTVSSPWPDRIEIDSVSAVSASQYSVSGRVIEVTSVEATNGGGAAYEIPVRITVQDGQGHWEITAYAEQPAAP